MSVKNVGSKLVRGVRQIKEHQDSPETEVVENVPAPVSIPAPVVAEAKPASPRARAKPAPTKASQPSIAHPDRVWPD
ncbi:MAG: hypothetical protein HOP20_07265 [Sulfuriferula sp.]|nr:hypothetical protein [Sulfuriferula sp.]